MGSRVASCHLKSRDLWHSFITTEFCFLLLFFNFPHLILQCGSGGNEKHEKQTREGENEAFEKCGKIAFHLFFLGSMSRLEALFKEQGEEIDCRCETFIGVVAARVVITCLYRHILMLSKVVLPFNVSRDKRQKTRTKFGKRFETQKMYRRKERLMSFDCLTYVLSHLKQGKIRKILLEEKKKTLAQK